MTKTEQKTIEKIAREYIPSLNNRPNLEPMHADEHDFFGVSVWCLKDALTAAYEAGKATSAENPEPASKVPTGNWRKYSSDEWICSHCGYDKYCDTLDGGELPPYCEKCGAKMQNYLTAADNKRGVY